MNSTLNSRQRLVKRETEQSHTIPASTQSLKERVSLDEMQNQRLFCPKRKLRITFLRSQRCLKALLLAKAILSCRKLFVLLNLKSSETLSRMRSAEAHEATLTKLLPSPFFLLHLLYPLHHNHPPRWGRPVLRTRISYIELVVLGLLASSLHLLQILKGFNLHLIRTLGDAMSE